MARIMTVTEREMISVRGFRCLCTNSVLLHGEQILMTIPHQLYVKRGCALTSAVMVLRYYGVTTGIDGKEVNSRNLNEWLKSQPRGYVGRGRINWGEVHKRLPNETKMLYNV